MDITEESIISFCSGYSGIELGFELAGFRHRVISYVEIEAFAVANLVAKMEQGHLVPAPVWTNLKTFPVEKFRGRVDGITAGYPCQPFSAAGQRKGTDDPRHLWPYIRQAIRTIQPRWCFFENVEGHVSLGLSTVISDLEEDGYRTTWGLFSAEEVGAPHRRKRVFILAHSKHGRKRDAQEQGVLEEREMCEGEPNDRNEVRGNSSGCGEVQLADTAQQGLERKSKCEKRNIQFAERSQWPSRPGEEQYKWEEPRVVNTSGKREKRKESEYGQGRGASEAESRGGKESVGEIEPGVGSTTHGSESNLDKTAGRVDNTRVDELRILGNGVVPQTAAKAWIELNKRMSKGA